MKKQLAQKIILSLIIFTVVTPFVNQYPNVEAANKIEWDNPSKSGNPYKIQLTDTLNAKTLVDVVSCTGIVDNVSKAVTKFTQDQIKKILKKKLQAQANKWCESGKTSSIAAVAAAMNLSLTDIANNIKCGVDGATGLEKFTDPETQAKIESENDRMIKINNRKECLNGIAYTLAKNQLATMTKYTMNWVNSGFSGDPMYVRNIDSFMGNMTDDIMMKELNMFKGQPQYYPYGNSYYRGTVLGLQSAKNFKESMKQNLSNYLGSGGLGNDAANVVERYTNNFGEGGWNAWLAFTQYPQNNYLGYTLKTTEYIANEQSNQIENTKEELNQNGGFFSQKKCVLYDTSSDDAIKKAESKLTSAMAYQENICESTGNGSEECLFADDLTKEAVAQLNTLKNTNATAKKSCLKWETVTPGSVIGAKINTTLNSPERQLELADTINESLSVLFSSLINTLQNNGLSSLSSYNTDFGKTDMGGNGYNSVLSFDPVTNEVMTSSNYTNESVDLTKDLGNTYIKEDLKDLINKGNWDAKSNTPKLYAGVGETNTYYTVSVSGNTEIIKNGYNGWAKGDRAFFNGTEWQNWKAGTRMPILKRGIVQIQQDYLVASKELLAILPSIMPKIGELDYCIPGPNPSWESNTSDTSKAFTEYVSGLETDYTPKGGFLGNREYVTIVAPDISSTIYKTYKEIFGTNQNLWRDVINTYPFSSIGILAHKRDPGLGWKGSYSDGGRKYSRPEEAIGLVSDLKDKILREMDLFKTKYNEEIKKIYGSGFMLKEYIEDESTYKLTPNTGYLEMANSGLNVTKDILSYNDKIKEATDSYKGDMVEAGSNIQKLNIIKDRVSFLIKQAQGRRDKNKAEIIKNYNEINDPDITIAQYDKCVKEEDISFYDDTELFDGKAAGENGRCEDGVDNDLDGLIDGRDPDCGWKPEPTAPDAPLNYENYDPSRKEILRKCTDSDASNYNSMGECIYN